MRATRLKPNRSILFGLFAAALLIVAACGGQGEHGEQSYHHEGDAVSAAHPDVKPAIEAGSPVYFCPMHPDVISAEQGQCDACGGMRLVEHKGLVYGCPMHPDEVTTDIESECRVCGMDLDELKKKEAAEAKTQPSV